MTVSLERDDELETDYVISSCYHGEKEQFWWIIVGDKKNNKVLTTKRTLVKQKAEINVSFDNTGIDKVAVYALCDSYIGCDQAEEVSLQ